MISEAEYQNALATPLALVGKEEDQTQILSWYEETVVSEAVALLCDLYEMDAQQAKKLLYTGGLTVFTACDPGVQQNIEAVYTDPTAFPQIEDSLIQPQSACVVIDPKSGAILGIAGARGEKTENRILNYATDTLRPPGSALKPLSVYAPAMEAGWLNAATVYDDTPVDFVTASDGWPHNYPAGYRGLTTVEDAVARSVNTVAVKVLGDYGVDRSFLFLRDRLHLSSLVSQKKGKDGNVLTDRAYAPLALGQLSYGVSVKELTAGYTIFADGGRYHAPFTVWELQDGNGTPLFVRQTQGERVLSEENAQAMTQILKGVTTKGTASRLRLAKQMDVAGKTGTTSEDCDRWFVGYTSHYLCGVWFGYSNPQPLHGFSETTSPALAAWDAVMRRLEAPSLHRGDRAPFSVDLLQRANYCKDSGKCLTASCLRDVRPSRVATSYFTRAQLPRTGCDCHIDVLYDAAHGGVCLGGCEGEHVHLVGMLRVSGRDFPRQVIVEDAQYVYRPLGDAAPSPSSSEAFFAPTLPKGHYVGISRGKQQFNRACYDHWYAWHFPLQWEEDEEEEKTP